MIPESARGETLARIFAAEPLVAAWFAGQGDGPSATADLASCLSGAVTAQPAPWFASAAADAWCADLAADLAGEEDRKRVRDACAALRQGRARVVVTGQQPGFLGGPLYTLHKVATAITLARRLSAAGQPTIPLFWSGDDDDDLPEAVAPVAWLPGSDTPVRSEWAGSAGRRGRERRMIGRLSVAGGQANGTAWLRTARPVAADPDSPAALWSEAEARGWTWGRLQRRALLRTFAGSALLVVSGDDPRLHEVAAPLYGRVLAARAELADAARQRGRELQAQGWHAQIGEPSLRRPLFLAEGDRRRPLGDASPAGIGRLRPGVMLRSPVQDWLLQPAAVVVGPAEYAYLRQLTTVYRRLGIARSPLVPRLFAWLLPRGFDRTMLAGHSSRRRPAEAAPAAALERWQDEATRRLAALLAELLPGPSSRAEVLAAGRVKRWRKGLETVVRNERAARARDPEPGVPFWVLPDGQRQERRLAWGAARAVWGPDLARALLEAADRHLDAGQEGAWCEWEIAVKKPESGHE